MIFRVLLFAANFSLMTLTMEGCNSNSESIETNPQFPHHLAMTSELIEKFVNRGYVVLSLLNEGKTVDYKNAKYSERILSPWPGFGKGYSEPPETSSHEKWAYLEDIISVVWALDAYAKASNNQFVRGSFSVIDDNLYLMSFFDTYMKVLYPEYSLDKMPFWLANNIAYNRSGVGKTSHYLNGQSLRQWGIDMRFHEQCYTLPILPYGMTHLLVGRVKTNKGLEKTFIKWEPHGMGDKTSLMGHAQEWFFAPKIPMETMKREKDILPKIENEGKKIGINRPYDIAHLWDLAVAMSIGTSLKNMLLNYYNGETMPWRTGNEVVFKLTDLSHIELEK